MKLVLLLALLTVGESHSTKVVGRTGNNVALPCHYDIKTHGSVYVCWNRGEIPYSGCNNQQLIATDGHKVIENKDSSRYQLLGRLDQGDVSLTILNLKETDAGRYGCRVEIPGWFNDEKHHVDLTVDPAPSVANDGEAEIDVKVLTSPHITTVPTAGHARVTGGSDVNSMTEPMAVTDEEPLQQQGNSWWSFLGNTVRVSFVIFIPALMLTAVYMRRRGRDWQEAEPT